MNDDNNNHLETIELTPEQEKARSARNIAIALALLAFVIIVFWASWVKMSANADRMAEKAAGGQAVSEQSADEQGETTASENDEAAKQ